MEIRYNIIICLILMAMCCTSSSNRNIEVIQEDEEEMINDNQYFIPNTDGFVYITDEYYLEKLYEQNYRSAYPSFEEFKDQALGGLFNLNYKTIQCDTCVFYYYHDRFILNEEIMAYYQNNGIDNFKTTYCSPEIIERKSNDEYECTMTFKQDPSELRINDKMTIAYCMWMNGYTFIYDACFAIDYFYKITSNPL